MLKCLRERTPNSSFVTAADSLKGFPVTPLPTLPLPVIKLACVVNNTTVCDSRVPHKHPKRHCGFPAFPSLGSHAWDKGCRAVRTLPAQERGLLPGPKQGCQPDSRPPAPVKPSSDHKAPAASWQQPHETPKMKPAS